MTYFITPVMHVFVTVTLNRMVFTGFTFCHFTVTAASIKPIGKTDE
ncbi:hypothetical protein [Marinicella pacifica]